MEMVKNHSMSTMLLEKMQNWKIKKQKKTNSPWKRNKEALKRGDLLQMVKSGLEYASVLLFIIECWNEANDVEKIYLKNVDTHLV